MVPIPEFPGYYATEDGNIYSKKTHRFIKQSKTRDGYFKVSLFREGKDSTQEVHRLVAAAYLGPARGRYVLHGPAGKEDNSISNLRYGTHDENMQDKYAFGATAWEWPEGYVPLLSANDVREISLYVADGVSDRTIAHWYCIPIGSVQPVSRNEPGSYRLLVMAGSDFLESD
jgi:hypothetical protein